MTTVMLHDGAAAPRLERPQPAVKVVRGGDYGLNRARRFARMVARVLALAIVLGLVISVLYSHAKLTELSGEINEVNTQLAAARSEYDYLSTRMSDITSRASLQEVAEGQLGLVKLARRDSRRQKGFLKSCTHQTGECRCHNQRINQTFRPEDAAPARTAA